MFETKAKYVINMKTWLRSVTTYMRRVNVRVGRVSMIEEGTTK